MNDSSYCRLCAHLRPNSDLITVIKTEVASNLNLDYKIYHCFQVQIEINDKLPKSICSDCHNLVISTYELIEKVQKAQVFLNNVFSQIESNDDYKVEWVSNSDLINNDFIKSEEYKDNDSNLSDYNVHTLKNDDSSLDSDDVPLIRKLTVPETTVSNKNCKNSEGNIYDNSKGEKTLEEWGNYNWRCNLCSSVIQQSVKLLHEHYITVHNKKPEYVCNECDKAYLRFDNFKRHYRTTHRTLKYEFKCEKCGKLSHTQKLHDKHMAKHMNNDCDNDNDNDCSTYECEYCHKKCVSDIALEEHREIHTEWKKYIWRCNICSEEVHNNKQLIHHFKTKHNKAPEYFCTECSKVYTKYVLFKQHVRKHWNACQFRCDMCGKLFHDKRILKKHMKFIHEQSELPKYICSVCGKVFKWQTSFAYHKLHFHVPTEVKLQYECDICHKKVATEKSLAAHKEIHQEGPKKNHTCELCGLAFRQKGTLNSHLRHTHSSNKDSRRQCPICLKVLKHETQLRRHTLNVHSTEKRFECETCGKKFYLRSRYTVHMRLHTGETPYACRYCPKRFRLKESMETHTRQHTGEKPYSCVDCNHDFTDFANYIKHMKRKHGVTSFKNVKKFSESNSTFKQNISVMQNVLS